MKNFQKYTSETCIPNGVKYIFKVIDGYGDGLRDDAYYKLYIDGFPAFSGGKNYRERSHELNLTPQSMTLRDEQWLESHNRRREQW